jgi:hypothetical protein
METFTLLVTRIDSSGTLLVVPYEQTLDFNVRRVLGDRDFAELLEQLGMAPDQIRLTLDRSRPAPLSFELRFALSKKQRGSLYACFPLLAQSLCSVA